MAGDRADQAVLQQRVNAIVNIPAEFEHDLVNTRTAPMQLILDAKDGAAVVVPFTVLVV